MMKTRIYVCHTFYHVYISCLKELYLLHEKGLPEGKAAEGSGEMGRAHLMLSAMSNDFSGMTERAGRCPLFEKVIPFDEKRDTFFPELAPLKTDTGNIVRNMINRIRFCRRFPELLAPYVPVDFRDYDDIYVFCDIDPVGFYLNGNRIPYHAVEDGLDTLVYANDAVFDNRGFFRLKTWMAARGLIHIQSGYSRYCIDMEVNDLASIKTPNKKMVELPRARLTKSLTQTDKDLLLDLFLDDMNALKEKLMQGEGSPRILILSEPLCEDLSVRRQIFLDLIDTYGRMDDREGIVFFKQHPRDELDYTDILTKGVVLLDKGFPMEMLYFFEHLSFDRVVSVYTVLDAFTDVIEKIRLGDAFMDRYEDPEKHQMSADQDAR